MFSLTILILTLLAWVNYRAMGKTLFSPAVVFCVVWASALLLAKEVGDFFYPFSPQTLFLFMCGAVAFSLGSWAAACFPAQTRRADPPLSKTSSRVLTLLVLVIAAATPLCYLWLREFTSGEGPNYLSAVYTVLSVESNQLDKRVSIFLNLSSFSNIVAMIAFYERKQNSKRSVIAIVFSLALNILGGGRTGFTSLILALIGIDAIQNRRLRWKPLLAAFLAFFILSGVFVIYVQKGEARADASLQQNAVPILQMFVAYASGGLVAFDRVVREPGIVKHNWHINRFFLLTLNRFGAHSEVPELKADFVAIGPHLLQINVYTFYFAYMDFGYFGMMLIVLVLGFIITLCYMKAISGSRIAVLMYGLFFGGVVLSIYFEPFFMPIISLLKPFVVFWLLFRFPAMWVKFSQLAKRSVDAQLVGVRMDDSR